MKRSKKKIFVLAVWMLGYILLLTLVFKSCERDITVTFPDGQTTEFSNWVEDGEYILIQTNEGTLTVPKEATSER